MPLTATLFVLLLISVTLKLRSGVHYIVVILLKKTFLYVISDELYTDKNAFVGDDDVYISFFCSLCNPCHGACTDLRLLYLLRALLISM